MSKPNEDYWGGLIFIVVAVVFITLAVAFGNWWFVLWGFPVSLVLPFVALWAVPHLHLRLRHPWRYRLLHKKEHVARLEAELGIPLVTDGVCGNKACGKSLPVGAKFCPYCGKATMKVALLCPECKTRLPEDGKYCPECGHAVPKLGTAAHA